jgi:hypothetical protein
MPRDEIPRPPLERVVAEMTDLVWPSQWLTPGIGIGVAIVRRWRDELARLPSNRKRAELIAADVFITAPRYMGGWGQAAFTDRVELVLDLLENRPSAAIADGVRATAKRYCAMCDRWVQGKECPRTAARTQTRQRSDQCCAPAPRIGGG